MQILYLARKDKRAVKILGVCNSETNLSHKLMVLDIDKIFANLDENLKFNLINFSNQNKMDYDLFLQNFSSFDEFKIELSRYGYKGLPNSLNALFFTQKADVHKFKDQSTIKMVQRNSRNLDRKK